MRTIIVFFDSLNRRMLAPYGFDWVKTPNFDRLAKHSVTFDSSYVGSMPCIPARHDLHTGRLNFLHRGWGPMEPYDTSVFSILQNNGIYTHLISDHMHYWEEGGANYHTKYSSWELVRGQEGDLWKAHPGETPDTTNLLGRKDYFRARDIINRRYMKKQEDYPIHQVFSLGLEFLQNNVEHDNWLLQIESFDPHEPFFAHEVYKMLYPDDYTGEEFDWPDYKRVDETPEQVQHAILQYAALVSACDDHLGKVLDFMDENNMWDDTMLIVCTDHGYLLGEHGWWAKNRQPLFNEIANTPFFIWDTRCKVRDERREQLVQLIDVAPTLLEAYNIDKPDTMQGVSLYDCIKNNGKTRDMAMFGIHGCHVNITDGRYVYMRAPVEGNQPLFDYTLMPANMRKPFREERLRQAELVPPFGFSKGMPLLKVPAKEWSPINFKEYGTLLYDLKNDSRQLTPFSDRVIEDKMVSSLINMMRENDCPKEQFTRLGLNDHQQADETNR
jgi:arylsulfatase A-like enzyme